MFNLFGSFFFGRAAAAACNDTNLQEVVDQSAVDASTQTTTMTTMTIEPQPGQLLMVSQHGSAADSGEDTLQRQWVIVEKVCEQQQSQQPQTVQQQNVDVSTSTTRLERVEEEMQLAPAAQQQPEEIEVKSEEIEDDDNDVLLGSFFDRNQFDNDSRPLQPQQSIQASQPHKDEWLITPLPCLTSITASQRSIVDNDPLENLLIEHPSMSVFVSRTIESVTASTTTPLKPSYSENAIRKEDSLTSTLVLSSAQKKRKDMEPSPQQQQSQAQTSPSPTSTMRRCKASKRNKKSLPSTTASSPVTQQQSQAHTQQQQTTTSAVANSSANKENTFVRTLLTSEFRSKTNPASKLDSILLSKNQMKRNNKHAAKFNSNNCIQRKFHKLQQPVCC